MYCGVERNLDAGVKSAMKKRIVEKALGVESSSTVQKTKSENTYKICPGCKEKVPNERNFCTSCGKDVRGARVVSEEVTTNSTEILPEYLKVKNETEELSIDFRRPELALIAISIIFFLIMIFIPYGIAPSGGARGYFETKYHVPFSVILLFILTYAFTFIDISNAITVDSEKRALRVAHGVIFLTCLIGSRWLFASISRILEIGILSAPAHFVALRLVKNDKTMFWKAAAALSSITALIILPYAKTIYLADVPVEFGKLTGYLIHVIGASLLFLGCSIRAFKNE